MKKKQFKDDKYDIIEVDIQRIRTRPTMFISAIGEAGVFHLCKELIDNASDEAMKVDSPCDAFTITMTDKQIRVVDNGRGIPTDIMQKIYETMQAGTNMTRSNGATRGENSLGGSTCLLALSSYLKVVSTRPNEHKRLTLVYKEAELVDRILEEYNGDEHGLDVTYSPSKKVMGYGNIPVDKVLDWLKDFDYTLHPNTNVTYIANGKTYKVQHKPLKQFFGIDREDEKCLSDTLSLSFHGDIDETFMDKTTHRKYKIDFALMYANNQEDIRHSWMNMIYTPENGDHVDGVIRALTKYLTEECVRRNKRLQGEDLRKDILAHMQLVVRGECDMAHIFSSQSKHKVLSKSLGQEIAKKCYDTLNESNHTAIGSIVEAILGNHRARMAGEQARDLKSVTKVKKQWSTPDSFIPCSNVKTDHPKELFLVEGNSAGGGLNGARDARYQAILFFKGKPLNTYESDPQKALTSDSWKHVIPTLECGYPPDLKKLKYDKIIITTDADIDGFHIRVMMCTFFMRFLPELINAGKLYIAEPPLYKLVRGKDVKYVATQTEYIQQCIKSIGDLKTEFPMSKIKISTSDFVTDAFDYLNILKECSINRSVNRYLLEYIAFGIAHYGSKEAFIKHIDKWLKSVASVFREIGYDHTTNQIYSVIELTDNFVMIDDELITELSSVIDILKKYGLMIHYTSNKRKIDEQCELSHFFEYIEDIYPQIKGRYKGLGSSDPEVLREVVMDPSVRRIYRVTMNDAIVMSQMGALVGQGKDCINQRKDMLMNFKFTKADIDS